MRRFGEQGFECRQAPLGRTIFLYAVIKKLFEILGYMQKRVSLPYKSKNTKMQAYEFKAVVRDGLIRIPEQLFEKRLSNVRVIILADSVNKVSKSTKNKFTAMRLKTKGFTFNREEIHER